MGLSPEERAAITHDNTDTSDCGVVALMSVADLDYKTAAELLGEFGYTKLIGTPRFALPEALKKLGLKHEILVQVVDMGETPATFAMKHEWDRARYLIYTEGHVSSFRDGELFNARGSWSMPVQMIVKVEL